MKLTKAIKKWLVDNMKVAADASDEDFRKALGQAVSENKLSPVDLMKLSEDEDTKNANEFVNTIKSLDQKFDQLISALTPKKEEKSEVKESKSTETKAVETPEVKETKEVVPAVKAPTSNLSKMFAAMGGTPDEVDGKSFDVRVKDATEMYSDSKSTLLYPSTNRRGGKHHSAGQVVMNDNAPMQTSSERDKALAGVWAKFQIYAATPRLGGNAQRAWEMLTEHEKQLMLHLTENEQWDASKDGRPGSTKGYMGTSGGRGLKALIDDSTSGGLEAAPIVFDAAIIEAPLLYGELFPLVNKNVLDRGRRVEGVATGRVTGSWGGVDNTPISLFDTTSYVSAFDTTIFRWEGAVRIGLDFLSDTPIDFGAHITRQYGEALLEDLDDVIAVGNGTTQPEGIMNASGTTTVAWGGTTSLGNYESLRFAVSKAEHNAAVKNSAVFCGTETSYMRATAIPVGASDARRLGGMDYDSYQWMQRPYKINESLTNSQIFYAILARYRMYIRRGLAIRTSTEGADLMTNNEILVIAMARYGGQIERGAAVGRTTTAPA